MSEPSNDVLATTQGTLVERMGIELLDVSAERVAARMPVGPNTQPYGLLHGGASLVLAECVAGLAAATHAGPGRTAVAVDVSATHHRAARHGDVTAVATALSLVRDLASYEVVITGEDGRRLCTARASCLIREAGTDS